MEGTEVGPYRVVRELGAGGMGTVWLAERDGARVALKVLHWHLLSTPSFVERFLREGRLGLAIRHPNVAATLDVGTVARGDEAFHYIANEYVEGRTLRDLLGELGTLPEETCRHVGRELARALDAIHTAGLLHRDVKPENVLVTADRAVKLADLGVARPVVDDAQLSTAGAFVGSVQYAAPEQFRTRDLDGRADLYALGIVLFEIATGTHPFAGARDPGESVRDASIRPPRRPSELNPRLTPFFDEVVGTLLERERTRRFGAAAELAAVLDAGEHGVWWRHRVRAIGAPAGPVRPAPSE